MRKNVVLFIILQGLTGYLFSQTLTTREHSPFSVYVTGDNGSGTVSENHLISEYSLGGHLFAGQYPINNPFGTGDTGIIYLYRYENNIVTPVDTTSFHDFGYFLFPNVTSGTYILKARLTKSSSHFNDYFPTYLTSDIRWNTSVFLDITDKSIFEANIRLVPTIDSITGPASIKGYVVQATSEQGLEVMNNTEVILFNEKMNQLTYSISDHSGSFYFPDLPYGTYFLIAESTGKFPALLRITLDQNHTEFDSVLLESLTHNPATVEELENPPKTVLGPVFPNPATDYINIVIRTTEPENLTVDIYSLNCQKIISFDYYVPGIRSLNIPVVFLPMGTYLLVVRTDKGQWRQVQKFVKI
jgi:hypothetical protein